MGKYAEKASWLTLLSTVQREKALSLMRDTETDRTPSLSLATTGMQKEPQKRSSGRSDETKVIIQKHESPLAIWTIPKPFSSPPPIAAKLTSLSSPVVVHLDSTATEDVDERDEQVLRHASTMLIEVRQHKDLSVPELCTKNSPWSYFLATRTRFVEYLGLRAKSAPAGRAGPSGNA